ncbi:hypothetical protein BpHYR1_042537 [Brachionus plicatilis]|uniref:Uncharacterized protein n=1 Tax=Brachionus plicatilis TaxID=10195 RepID=A0A3M7QDE0_BRAPC|nr:hypothetical protein BpHYR1_042537 [Brachionus plicatilis]
MNKGYKGSRILIAIRFFDLVDIDIDLPEKGLTVRRCGSSFLDVQEKLKSLQLNSFYIIIKLKK